MMCVLADGKENMMATINIEAEKKAYKKFIAAGMTPAGACGLIGNLEAESDGFIQIGWSICASSV